MADVPGESVEVVYARPERQRIVRVPYEPGLTAERAVQLSGLAAEFPEIHGQPLVLGVFGVRVRRRHLLRERRSRGNLQAARAGSARPTAGSRRSGSRCESNVAVDPRYAVAVEVHDEPAPFNIPRSASAEVVGIVPAIAMEAIRNHGRPEQELDLTARHADLNLIDVDLLEQVSLLNVDAVDATDQRQTGQYDCGEAKADGKIGTVERVASS